MPELTEVEATPLVLRLIVARCLVDWSRGYVYNIRATICLLSFSPFAIEASKETIRGKKEEKKKKEKEEGAQVSVTSC